MKSIFHKTQTQSNSITFVLCIDLPFFQIMEFSMKSQINFNVRYVRCFIICKSALYQGIMPNVKNPLSMNTTTLNLTYAYFFLTSDVTCRYKGVT